MSNPNGIEPTFLKLDSWSPGAGFIPIIISNVLNKLDKGIKNSRKKISFLHTKKHLTQFLKMGSIPRLPFLWSFKFRILIMKS